jgi:uncharacterized Zn-binding protein involved in type VI secretion
MSGLPAARIFDGVAHDAGGNIIQGSPNVFIGAPGRRAARKSDLVQHDDGLEAIAEGEPTVLINGLPAARITDAVSCDGRIATGCGTVNIGHARGRVVGNVQVGQKMCLAAIKGRNLKSLNRTLRNLSPAMQSYSNCAIESARQIINQATGKSLTEDGLLQYALDHGDADYDGVCKAMGTPPTSADGAASLDGQVSALMRNFDVPAVVETSSLDSIGTALANRQGVIAEVDASVLWQGVPGIVAPNGFAPHAVTVTGIEYDDNGNITNVVINDSAGQCSRKVSVDQWNKAVQAIHNAVDTTTGQHYAPATILVTQNPIF